MLTGAFDVDVRGGLHGRAHSLRIPGDAQTLSPQSEVKTFLAPRAWAGFFQGLMADAPDTDTASPLLSPTQRRIAGFALGLFATIAAGALMVGLALLGVFLLGVFSGVLWPLVTAGIMALVLMPLVHLLESRLRVGRVSAVVTIYGAFLLAATGLFVTVVPPAVSQLLDFITFLPALWERALSYGRDHYPQWVETAQRYLENPDIKAAVKNLVNEARGLATHAVPSLKAAGSGVLSLFGFFTSLAIIPIYLFFFLLSSGDPTKNLGDQLNFLKPGLRDDLVFLVREFIAIVISFFRGQLIIGLLMGVLLALGFTLIGLKFGLFIGLMLGILNIVPYLGTIIGLSIALPLAFLQPAGGVQLVGLVLLVFIIVQNIEGWYLTPKIMGQRTGLHPVTIIVAIFFWGTALGGILGMILAIPLTAFFVTAWRLVKRKYLSVLSGHMPDSVG
ncbi:MAG: AI-2E family transporter [Verrucomicrobia bacterium]|nr:AI-2E family transporter [Verrucomicrobiota bacterium]